jgi:hypothetical protein
LDLGIVVEAQLVLLREPNRTGTQGGSTYAKSARRLFLDFVAVRKDTMCDIIAMRSEEGAYGGTTTFR